MRIMSEAPIEGPDGGPLGLEVVRAFQRDPLGFLTAQQKAHGDVVRLPFAGTDVYLLARPDLVRDALTRGATHVVKWQRLREPFERVASLNLVILEGDAWAEARRIASQAFLPARAAAGVPRIAAHAEGLCAGWRDGEVLDVDAAMSRLHLGSLVEFLLGVPDVVGAMPALAEALDARMAIFMAEARSPVLLPAWIPTPRNREREESQNVIEAALHELLRERRARGAAGDDVLSALLDAVDPETGRRLTEAEAVELVLSLFVAGRETPVRALAWTAWLIAQHPDVQERLHRELDAGGPIEGARSLRALGYLRQVIHEALRLYPPAWSLVFREVTAPLAVGGHVLPVGAVVYVSTYLLHHDARSWPEPERFQPERFAEGWEARVPEGAYVPFGAAPRPCLGRDLVMTEVSVILATVLRRFELRPVGDAVAPEAAFTLQPAGPLRVEVRRRP